MIYDSLLPARAAEVANCFAARARTAINQQINLLVINNCMCLARSAANLFIWNNNSIAVNRAAENFAVVVMAQRKLDNIRLGHLTHIQRIVQRRKIVTVNESDEGAQNTLGGFELALGAFISGRATAETFGAGTAVFALQVGTRIYLAGGEGDQRRQCCKKGKGK